MNWRGVKNLFSSLNPRKKVSHFFSFALLSLFLLTHDGLFSIDPSLTFLTLPRTIKYNKDLASLGEKLFFDTRLSGGRKYSCAGCHNPFTGGDDGLPTPMQINFEQGARNTPTIFNVVFNFRQYWDGRSTQLLEQVKESLTSPSEMSGKRSEIEKVLQRDLEYKKLFSTLFENKKADFDNAAIALLEFEQALITPNSRFDQYLRGEIQFSPQEKAGMNLFSEMGCISCHNGINLGGNSFQFLNVHSGERFNPQEISIAIFSNDQLKKKLYKTPSLRNIALTAPYFHNGTSHDLRTTVKNISSKLFKEHLREDEIDALVIFLHSLTGETPIVLREGMLK